MTPQPSLAGLRGRMAAASPLETFGRVSDLIGLIVAVRGLKADLGELCTIHVPGRDKPLMAEVVGFRHRETLIMPLGDLEGIGPGAPVAATGRRFEVRVGSHLLGRVLDGLGRPMDDLGPITHGEWRSVEASPPNPMRRGAIEQRMRLGVRAMDTLIPCGLGQRLGIFAGSGVGKSSLLGMIARYASADVNVICLVGERGREVQEFINRDLGPDGLNRSVVVCATSDRPALERIKAVLVATTIAEHFRDQGANVLLMCDSATRLAMAQREVGLAVGEPPATRGYPPSVWAMLPQVLERAGATLTGSITALYTVLVEGDDMNEPISDAVRAILDGHVVLKRELAHRNHYPAIDVLESISRLNGVLLSDPVKHAGGQLRETMAAYKAKEDLISIGAISPGADPLLDYAIAKQPQINEFLRQRTEEPTEAEHADQWLVDMMADRAQAVQAAAGHAQPAGAAVPVSDEPAIPRLGI